MLKISTVSYQEKSMDNYNNNGYDNGYNNNDNRNNNHNNNNNNKKPKNVNLIIFIIIAAVVTFIGLTLLSNMFRNATYKEISRVSLSLRQSDSSSMKSDMRTQFLFT